MTAVVSPARLRSTMAEETGIVRVTIPARRNWLLVGVLCAWLCGWSMGEMMAVRAVWAKSDPFVGMRSGPLAFDYGAKTIRFGSGVDEAEARVILASIRTRFPELAT